MGTLLVAKVLKPEKSLILFGSLRRVCLPEISIRGSPHDPNKKGDPGPKSLGCPVLILVTIF